MFIDIYSHIYSGEYNGEVDEVIKRALEQGVTKIMLPNIDSSSIKMMLDLADSYTGICFPMIGIHPTSVKEDFKEELEVVEFWLSKRKFYAIGEVGIDLYWDKTFREEQEYVFSRQIQLAKQYDLPISIHVRESYEVVTDIIKKEYYPEMKGVFHCFSGTAEQADHVISMGFKIGIGGTVTFKNSGVDTVVQHVDLKNIILETDSPYLAPAPLRGKRNESANLTHIAHKVAQIKGITLEEVAETTTQTASQLFVLP